ncbi:biofilm regulation protein phosphatase SiaA [Chitinimonas viridis]|uniref:Biofilm regulation protein phosphatase SiaA n=1 Tax=Chitinimonas viridis TaxID=664880 RepID=A0ABT8B6Q1_9NEIS|nr:biofilm regulation protein phosphatase SiaA [Chitinimonas viridis]MDN3577699.1 biofilm regulation protein phosphatase SiaA [Chitinimonas viridis]
MAALGLRGKSLLALVLACLIALIPAVLIGWQLVDNIRNHFGLAYARNFTQLNQQKILAPISRELALSMRLADSEVTRQWLQDETDPAKSALFFREAEGYRRDFRDHSYFVISNGSRRYFLNEAGKPASTEPRYTLDPADSNDAWFFNTMRSTAPYNININHDHKLKVTRVWFNVVVSDGDRKLGLAGTGLDLSNFLRDFIVSGEKGVTPMILDRRGAIQAHPDETLIAFNSGTQQSGGGSTLFRLLKPDDEIAVRQAMQAAEAQPNGVHTTWVSLAGKQQLLAVAYLPELQWHVATAVDLHTAKVLDAGWLAPAAIALGMLLVALLLGFGYAAEHLVLKPLRRLHQSARAIAAGEYDVALPHGSQDEIGELSRAFGIMADKVRSHTTELESRVRERTQALERANREMVAAHKKIDDSIDYASLIQRAILPNRQLVSALGERHAVLWRPRDVVGGDFYVYRAADDACLFGVVDCAGHGVPGALMTMLGHAAIDQAILDVGLDDPAGILSRADQIIRSMLRDEPERQALATNMDVGLAYVDLKQRQVTFAGAKIALYFSDGDVVDELPGARRAIGDKRVGHYSNEHVPLLPGRTFYLSTDGFLDQAGGELGFGFGTSRFAEMLARHARLPLAEQGEAFAATLAAYQGEHAQRDDITMLCFRFD